MDAQHWIARLNLAPHPEGGYYREVYRAATQLNLPQRGQRSSATAIYYLLPSDQRSALHRLAADELWFFHAGAPLRLYLLDGTGLRSAELGVGPGQTPQLWVPAGVWFGAKVTAPDSFSLVSCAVTPGFDFADFELADRAALCAAFPEHAALISELT